MKIQINTPKTKKEFEEYYNLRWKILRKPWNQPKGSEQDKYEKDSIHIMVIVNNKIVGVGRIHFNSKKEAQIRYMAVKKEYRGKGIGTLILKELEKNAQEKCVKWIILNSREDAVKFYKQQGYKVEEKAHTLFGEIIHWKMKKEC